MKRRRSDLRIWIAISILLHLSFVFLPSQVVNTFFPKEVPQEARAPSDLVPDFDLKAFQVVLYAEDVEENTWQEPEREREKAPTPKRLKHRSGAAGTQAVEPEAEKERSPIFIPPRPRYVSPPDIGREGTEKVRIVLEILVSSSGTPLEVKVRGDIKDPAVERKIRDTAMSYRFEPARLGTTSVDSWVMLTLEVGTSPTR